MHRLTVLLLVVLSLLVGSFNVAQADLIQNGDFGQGDTHWGGDNFYVDDYTGILGDTYGYAALLDVPPLPINSPEATVGAAILAQDFHIAPGTTALQVSFDYLFTGTDTSETTDDASYATLSYQTEGAAGELGWTMFQHTSTSTEFGSIVNYFGTITLSDQLQAIILNGNLTFALLENYALFDGSTDTQLYIDNVSVSAIPLPSALLLFTSGLAGLALFPRKIVGKLTQRS